MFYYTFYRTSDSDRFVSSADRPFMAFSDGVAAYSASQFRQSTRNGEDSISQQLVQSTIWNFDGMYITPQYIENDGSIATQTTFVWDTNIGNYMMVTDLSLAAFTTGWNVQYPSGINRAVVFKFINGTI